MHRLVFEESGKLEWEPEKNLSVQSRESTNSTHIWRQVWETTPGHIGGRRVLSPLRHVCSTQGVGEMELTRLITWLLVATVLRHLRIQRGGCFFYSQTTENFSRGEQYWKKVGTKQQQGDSIQTIRWGTRFSGKLHTLIIIIEINFCNGANLRSFAIFIAMFSPSAHWVVEVVLIKVCALLILKRLHQRVKGLRAHIWNVKGFRRFVFHQPIRFVHQVCIR